MVEIAQEGPLAPTNQKLKESRRFSFLGQDVGAEELVPSCRGYQGEQESLRAPWRAPEHQADLAMEANLMGLEGRRSLETLRTQTDKTLARHWRGRSFPSGNKKWRGSQFEDVQGRIPTRTWAFEELEGCREVTGQAKEARVEDILRPERRRLITSDTAVICKTRSKENMIRDDFDLNNKVAPTGKRIPPCKTIPRNAFLLPGAIEEHFQFSVRQQSNLKRCVISNRQTSNRRGVVLASVFQSHPSPFSESFGLYSEATREIAIHASTEIVQQAKTRLTCFSFFV